MRLENWVLIRGSGVTPGPFFLSAQLMRSSPSCINVSAKELISQDTGSWIGVLVGSARPVAVRHYGHADGGIECSVPAGSRGMSLP